MSQRPKIVFIIPSYNEGERLSAVVQDILTKGYDNIVVVDDGSTDGSVAIIENRNVKILRHVVNRGAGAATETGLRFCREDNEVEIVVMIDADTQHDVNDVDSLIAEHLKQEADVTIGNRFIKGTSEIPFKNRVYNYVANLITSFFAGARVTDSQSGFKIFNRKALDSIVIEQDQYEHCSEILIKAHRQQLKIIDVPISVYYPAAIKWKGQHFISGIKTFLNIVYAEIFRKTR